MTERLQNQKLDVVLTDQLPARKDESSWVVHPLAEQEVSLVGNPAFGSGNKELKHILAEQPLIIPSSHSSIRIGFDALLSDLGVKPKVLAEVDDMALLRVMARENVALAVVPPIVVKDEIVSGRLVKIADLPTITETFYAVTMPRRFPSEALRTAMEAISMRSIGPSTADAS